MGVMIDLQPSAGPALVIGGGSIAARKVANLVAGGFQVTVIAPVICGEIAEVPGILCLFRAFAAADLGSAVRYGVVFACTDDRATNRLVGELARARSVPVVVADAAEDSTFFTPAALRDHGVIVAVSTGGESPAFARRLRDRIAAVLGDDWGAP